MKIPPCTLFPWIPPFPPSDIEIFTLHLIKAERCWGNTPLTLFFSSDTYCGIWGESPHKTPSPLSYTDRELWGEVPLSIFYLLISYRQNGVGGIPPSTLFPTIWLRQMDVEGSHNNLPSPMWYKQGHWKIPHQLSFFPFDKIQLSSSTQFG